MRANRGAQGAVRRWLRRSYEGPPPPGPALPERTSDPGNRPVQQPAKPEQDQSTPAPPATSKLTRSAREHKRELRAKERKKWGLELKDCLQIHEEERAGKSAIELAAARGIDVRTIHRVLNENAYAFDASGVLIADARNRMFDIFIPSERDGHLQIKGIEEGAINCHDKKWHPNKTLKRLFPALKGLDASLEHTKDVVARVIATANRTVDSTGSGSSEPGEEPPNAAERTVKVLRHPRRGSTSR